MQKVLVIYTLIPLFCLVGWVKCIIKAVDCNWDPIGKAEVIYTAGIFTGLGSVIGYIDIQDK